DRHAAIGSIFQPVHGARTRESMVYFREDGGRLSGYAIHENPEAISFQERWKDGRTDFRTVRFADNQVTLDFDIAEWRRGAGPLAVEEGRLENKGSIRI